MTSLKTSLKKKLIAGILSGAIFMTGGLAASNVYAAEKDDSDKTARFEEFQERHERKELSDEKIAELSKEISDYYGVDASEVSAALKNRVPFGDVRNAATLAKLSNRSFSEVLAMKSDWHQVAEKLGVTREQFDAFAKDEKLSQLAKISKLDKKVVEDLLKENYSPRDIQMAGIIANASGKNVKTVLSKRKINNSWNDVAKEYNVDLRKISRENRPHR